MPSTVYLLLGTNLGDSKYNLLLAQQQISREVGAIITTSSIYKSAAWGNSNQPDFLNQVIAIHTSLQPDQVLTKILQIETDMGRIRGEKWGPRIIDIDILLWGNLVLESDSLHIPHPGIPSRKFTLLPLAEIAGEIKHPVTGQTIIEMLTACRDDLAVSRL